MQTQMNRLNRMVKTLRGTILRQQVMHVVMLVLLVRNKAINAFDRGIRLAINWQSNFKPVPRPSF
jgi:hypothetical protein